MNFKKKITAGSLLMIYLSGIFYPLTPVIKDVFEHVFHHAHHMANVHHHHGNDHVHKEIKKAAEESGNNESTAGNREIAVHLPYSTVLIFLSFYKAKNFNLSEINFPDPIWISKLFPPPRLISIF